MLDYQSWAERAVNFTESLHALPGEIKFAAELHPPLRSTKIRDVTSQLRLPLPTPLLAFMITTSTNCHCKYWWRPPPKLLGKLNSIFPGNDFIFGGGSVDSTELAENDTGCRDWAEAFEEKWPEEAKVWWNSVPFHDCGNGDFIAFYVGEDRRAEEFPIVYLDHDGDGGTGPLAPSFDDFLSAWERLNYIHGFFLRQYFFDAAHGSINPESAKGARLRDLFRAALGDRPVPK